MILAQAPSIPIELTAAELTVFMFALIGLNIIMMRWVRIPILSVVVSLSSVIIGMAMEGVLGFPWLNLMLVITAIVSIYASIHDD